MDDYKLPRIRMITTRFAPSPTGYLHIGGLRTALYNFLFARKMGGRFLLRIEDTDAARNSPAAAAAIIEAFKWVGLDFDGEIIYQSSRLEIYKKYIQRLLNTGRAYHCYASPEELAALRASQEAAKIRPHYDGRYRDFTGTPPAGVAPVVRIKAPLEGEIKFTDGIKGELSFRVQDSLDDFIIARSDGSPTYNFTVVVDDLLMEISDVIRGDDHLSNTPKQLVIYEALGEAAPRFFHLAMIHGEDGKKLSKRHGATDVMEFKNMGVLAQALLNFLVRLGWSCGDEELFTLAQLEKIFDPAQISRSASACSFKKLEWLNSHYIKTLPFISLNPCLAELGLDFAALPRGEELLDLLRPRAKNLKELISQARAIISRPASYEAAGVAKFMSQAAAGLLRDFVDEILTGEKGPTQEEGGDPSKQAPQGRGAQGGRSPSLPDPSSSSFFEEATQAFLAAKNASLKDLAQPLRLALTGGTVSPPVFELLNFLGPAEAAARVGAFLKFWEGGAK